MQLCDHQIWEYPKEGGLHGLTQPAVVLAEVCSAPGLWEERYHVSPVAFAESLCWRDRWQGWHWAGRTWGDIGGSELFLLYSRCGCYCVFLVLGAGWKQRGDGNHCMWRFLSVPHNQPLMPAWRSLCCLCFLFSEKSLQSLSLKTTKGWIAHCP